MSYDRSKEIQEAIWSGERAVGSLREAQGYLNSASGWGIVDIFGGGLLTDVIKHTRINKAKESIDRARCDLIRFRQELDDVDDYVFNIDVGDLWTVFDFVFDGFVADIVMQSKISDAKKSVADAIYQVESVVNRLKSEMNSNW